MPVAIHACLNAQDNSGILTHDEVESVEVDILPKKFLQTVHVNSMLELFDYLDVAGFILARQ